MKRMLTGNAYITLGLVCVSFLLPAAAFPWNQATHAYISDALAARTGHDNLQEMWGSVAPDFFNHIFDSAVCPGWVSDQTHGTYAETFLKVWGAAGSEKEDALAYGFLSHNQQWGADYVAHISGLRPGYENDGYIKPEYNCVEQAINGDKGVDVFFHEMIVPAQVWTMKMGHLDYPPP